MIFSRRRKNSFLVWRGFSYSLKQEANIKSWRIIAVIALLFFEANAQANAEEFEGVGIRTCAYFMQDAKADPSAVTDIIWFSWAQGFMSGLNVTRLNNTLGAFDAMPMEQQKAHIRSFCEANPDKKYFEAVIDLYTAIYPRKK